MVTIKKILAMFGLHKTHQQRTFIYCDCGNELIASNSFVSDTYDKYNYNHVLYKCTECDKETDFNFDIAPVPINWNDIKQFASNS